VFVIWEPILSTDWGRPSAGVLSRISDERAAQYWDKTHLFAKQLKHDLDAAHVNPECCFEKDILWDVAVVYPRQARWDTSLPAPAYLYGPVVRAAKLPGILSELIAGPRPPQP
jgi:hypothetical protein